VCGGPTEPRDAGHARACRDPDCAVTVFPRNDPAVIVLVADGDRCLLGRSGRFPEGMHSVLAGFVEAGESMEATVRREIREEAGIEVTDIRYHSSQPWPFPQSLMVGFFARAATRTIDIDGDELVSADWYDRGYLLSLDRDARPGEAPFTLPPRHSIARRLIEDWLARPTGDR
jgi:NAD+ diphosphatase